ncbi:MAG: acyl carrier protein [Opitutaceae bacterium]
MSTLHESNPDDDPALREALKRCSPATYYAACKFRKYGRNEDLRTVVAGVIERFVERELRPKLDQPDDTLRMREDLAIDSLTMMEVVMITEEVLGISVSNEELTQLRTLGEVHAFIRAKTSTPSAGANGRKSANDNRNTWSNDAVGEEVRQIEARASRSATRVSS